MSERDTDKPDQATNPEDAPEAQATPTDQGAHEQAADGDVDAVDNEMDQLLAERDELQSKVLRAMADYQNLARRSEVGVSNARQQAITEFARAMLPALDQFDSALEVDPDKTSVEALLQGMQMVQAELRKVLENHGVQRVDAQVGDEFDANVHEALMQQPAEGVKSNHITAQFQPGYVMGDRTIRPAKVSVAP